MGQLGRDCPHCHTKKVSFNSYGEVIRINTKTYITAFFCSGCYGGIIAEIKHEPGSSPFNYSGNIDASKHLRVLKIYPSAIETKAPGYLSENLKNFFLQAATSLESKNYDAAAIMTRKVLEVAVKVLDAEGSGDLYNRIESLSDKNLITQDLKDWAHAIRDDGNTAAHEETPVSKEFAEELLSFAEMFLMYTFTMPNMIKDRRHSDTD